MCGFIFRVMLPLAFMLQCAGCSCDVHYVTQEPGSPCPVSGLLALHLEVHKNPHFQV